jgi:hypothetical protein
LRIFFFLSHEQSSISLGGFRAAGLASYEAYLERVKQYRRDQGAQTKFKIRFFNIKPDQGPTFPKGFGSGVF